jgi:nitrate reductase (NAD(P)H)
LLVIERPPILIKLCHYLQQIHVSKVKSTMAPNDREIKKSSVISDDETEVSTLDDAVNASKALRASEGVSVKSNVATEMKEQSLCEKLYGPYPRAIPIPQLSEDPRDVAPATMIANAKTYKDVTMADYRDMKSPDEWVPRDGRLVRLTGKHPFNVEPPLNILDQYKFITPSSLHYVRNHGACPQLTWEDHTVDLCNASTGSKATVGMDAIVNMRPIRELPVTLVCAGNRRKEQNMMRQTIGFNWGGAGVATNVWKGILVRDVLIQCGICTEETFELEDIDQYHCEFIGVEDLPNKVGPGPFVEQGAEWGKLVKYGTSIPLARVLNPAYDIMLAYEANGELLQPDHGFPIRIIIPGYIGGRMIKWLAAINIIKHETYNHYHYHDNRILPPQITTAEQSLAESWWYKPEYIFNELNINSVITRPNHNDTLSIAENVSKTYQVAGYAYTGGGRKVTRIEVSSNGGVNWKIATIHRSEKPTKYGMHWCWVWWTYDMPTTELIGAKDLLCRAWDESNNTQAIDPTWNLMGMGNNYVFRVKIHVNATDFWFEHPTQPGQLPGGYMHRIADKPVSGGFGRILDQPELLAGSAAPAAVAPVKGTRIITMDEVKKHTTVEDVWIVVNDKVYDCTEYLELHPGGIESITMNGGLDATEDFLAIHSAKANKMLEKYYIGDLDKRSESPKSVIMEEPDLLDENGNKLALNPRRKVPFKLQEKITLSRDSYLLNFALPTPQHILGLPTGKHVFISAKIDGETVLRRYTPISCNHDVGCIKFVIKAYRPCERFPEGGKMSQYLDSIEVGDSVDFKGPVGEFDYLGNGRFQLEHEPQPLQARAFNMVAGGTGITPCMQIAAEILRHDEDPTVVSLIFAARIEEDLLLRDTLHEWSTKYPHKFRIHYILSDEWPTTWTYSTGFVDKALFQEYLYPAADDVYTLMCGPPIMIDRGCKPALKDLGHDQKTMFSF